MQAISELNGTLKIQRAKGASSMFWVQTLIYKASFTWTEIYNTDNSRAPGWSRETEGTPLTCDVPQSPFRGTLEFFWKPSFLAQGTGNVGVGAGGC